MINLCDVVVVANVGVGVGVHYDTVLELSGFADSFRRQAVLAAAANIYDDAAVATVLAAGLEGETIQLVVAVTFADSFCRQAVAVMHFVLLA